MKPKAVTREEGVVGGGINKLGDSRAQINSQEGKELNGIRPEGMRAARRRCGGQTLPEHLGFCWIFPSDTDGTCGQL